MVGLTSNTIDYLAIGHVAKDLTPEGPVTGGTVAYAGRTANALGLCVGIVTSTGADLDMGSLNHLNVKCLPAEKSTTFENNITTEGRQQILHAEARMIGANDIPPHWHTAAVVHHRTNRGGG